MSITTDMRHWSVSIALAVFVAVVSCLTPRSRLAVNAHPPADASSKPWLQYADVGQAGFDEPALRAVCERADVLRSGAVMAVYLGRVILACGDISRKFEAYSVRKSLVSGLYGTAVARGKINLDSTLADHGIDERIPLTASERAATIGQVISARSGIYLPAAYGASQERSRPKRGSHAPGTHWFYNNWDFNIAGVIYERATSEGLYESFERRLAKPLGMEDWDRSDGFAVYEPTKSRYPAHTFRISTRDLARFGQLYLQKGRWDGRQILPADWITESTRPHTDDGDGTGYGYMWWTYQSGSSFTAKYARLGKNTFYRGLGTGEQGVWVIPDEGLVIVHRADTDHDRTVDSQDHWALAESVLAARRREPVQQFDLKPVQTIALRSQLPPVTIPQYRALPSLVSRSYLGAYAARDGDGRLGNYRLTPGESVRVFAFESDLYLHLPGIADVQMFPNGRDTFAARVHPGIKIAFERDANGEATAVVVALGDDVLKASKEAAPRRP